MKGGVGKTTLAVNLAWHFQRAEAKRVLLVDLDPQFNATQYVMDYAAFKVHKRANGTIADLLIEDRALTTKIKKAKQDPSRATKRLAKNRESHLDILPADLDLARVVKNPSQMEFRLEKLLEKVRNRYDFVFVDCAPTDSVLTTMALAASDFVLIPMRPDRFSILGFSNLMETLKLFRDNCEDKHGVRVLGVVYTQVNGTPLEGESKQEVDAEAHRHGVYRFDAEVGYSGSFARSVRDQTPVFDTLYGRAKVKAQFGAIAAELNKQLRELGPTAGGPP